MTSAAQPPRGAAVLVVDDDPGTRETLVDLLAVHGIAAVAVGTAAAAEDFVRGNTVDLALVDQRLPDASGTDLAGRLHAIDDDLPVLLLTGYASAEAAMAAVGKADDFLVKPVRPDALVLAVRNGLERRRLRRRNAELVEQLKHTNVVLADGVHRRKTELATLIAMTSATASSSRLPLLVDAAVEVLARMPSTSAAGIYLRDGDRLTLQAARGVTWRPPQTVEAFEERVVRTSVDGHDCVLAALASDGVTVGAMLLERGEQEADEFLVALATQLAVGIENAQRSARERATVERIAELNRMKSSFLANVSHELRTPLTAVIGFARTLQGRGAALSAEEQGRLLERIEAQARRLHRLVEDLLDEASLGRGELRVSNGPVQVADVVTRTVAAVAEPRHVLEVDLPDRLPMVLADAERLEQVLANLLDNARKYAPAGSRITVAAALTARGLELSVSDEGPGIEASFAPQLFEPFTQADLGDTRRDSGVGLGLSICRRLVTAMGGTIELAPSRVGARFVVVLPRLLPQPVTATPDAARR